MEKENFDYLLGMTMWSLTKEKKDDLLRQRDEKISELKRLQARTPMSLWKEDLDDLLIELNKVNDLVYQIKIDISNYKIIFSQLEEKERKEESKSKQNEKKPPSRFYKGEDTRRILPVIDVELKKKIEKADIVSKDKKEGVKKPKVNILCVYIYIKFILCVCN